MKKALPELRNEIDELFLRFANESRDSPDETVDTSEPAASEVKGTNSDAPYTMSKTTRVAVRTSFRGFFAGAGPKGVLSGAAFQKNRLSATAAVYSTLFEDDLVSWLLGRPDEPLERLADLLALSPDVLRALLRELAWGYFRHRTKQAVGYPRYYVFEAYQSAALHLLAEAGGEEAGRASEVLKRRFPDFHGERLDPPKGFPPPDSALGIATFFHGTRAESQSSTKIMASG